MILLSKNLLSFPDKIYIIKNMKTLILKFLLSLEAAHFRLKFIHVPRLSKKIKNVFNP